ncbi:MAG: hypothetical protein KKB37_06865 [Alphaproteobacteria bacterium]|nr:hypothetical protein [Alphaproteobacteria bacterium]
MKPQHFADPSNRPFHLATFQMALRAVALLAAFSVGASVAAAQVIIVKSSAKDLRAGTLLDAKAKVSIPQGAQAVFVLPSGATRTVSGPFEGTAAELTKGVKSNPDVFEAVKRYVRTGGTTAKGVGAMRSAVATSFMRPVPFSWRAIPVFTSGDVCIEKNARLSLVRAGTSRPETYTIVEMQSNRRVRVSFDAGESSAPWPLDLKIDPRSTYAVLAEDRPMRQLRMRVIDPLPQQEDTLQVLHGQRCEGQFRAYIREMQSG